MPQLDVSEALDVLNIDSFGVISTTMAVGSTGQPASAPQPMVTAYGVVVPEGSSMKRLSDGTRLAGCIDIFTQYPLTAGWKTDDVTSQQADIVVWHGARYTVARVNDFSGFGLGYLYAQADLLPLMPTSPEPQVLLD